MTEVASMTGSVVRTPDVTIERVDVAAGTRLRGHGHDVAHLCFVMGGQFDERERGRWRTVDEGALRASPAGDEHDLLFRVRSRCLIVLVDGEPGGVAPQLPQERCFHTIPRASALAMAISRSMDQPGTSPLTLELHVLELLAAASLAVRRRHAAVRPPWLPRIRERMHEHPAGSPGAAELAVETGHHPVYVARVFREHYGVGLGEYARLVRAERARLLLAESDLPLARVALLAGYSDQSHLSRSLRRLLGCTPAQVRRRRGRIVQVASIQDASHGTP